MQVSEWKKFFLPSASHVPEWEQARNKYDGMNVSDLKRQTGACVHLRTNPHWFTHSNSTSPAVFLKLSTRNSDRQDRQPLTPSQAESHKISHKINFNLHIFIRLIQTVHHWPSSRERAVDRGFDQWCYNNNKWRSALTMFPTGLFI